MTDEGSEVAATAPPAGGGRDWQTYGRDGATAPPPDDDDLGPEPPRLKTGPAAKILGVDARTVERWIDGKPDADPPEPPKLRGGRPRDPHTGKPVKGSHRWVSAQHVVELAVGAGRADRVPKHLRYLIPELSERGGEGEATAP